TSATRCNAWAATPRLRTISLDLEWAHFLVAECLQKSGELDAAERHYRAEAALRSYRAPVQALWRAGVNSTRRLPRSRSRRRWNRATPNFAGLAMPASGGPAQRWSALKGNRCVTASAQAVAQSVNGSRTRIVSSRSGLVDSIATGAPISSSRRRMYLIAVAGRSAQERAPRVLSVQPSAVS